uniref:SFRICE_005076 n=1 Tax=Spodoptera frugiperda TaxID=7108 RepID=A0A2H1VHY9_SPOFR
MALAVFGSNRYLKEVTQNGEIKHPREDRHPRGRSRGRKRITGGAIPPFPIFPNPDSPTTLKFLTPLKAGNGLVTPLVFQVPMGSGNCLPSRSLNSKQLPRTRTVRWTPETPEKR